MSDMISAVLAAAATAAEDPNRGKLLYRVNGRECRLTAPDTFVISGGESTLVTQIEGVDLLDALT